MSSKSAFAFLALGSLSAVSPAADVVVYSGVPGGIAAAIAASREGAEVILVEPTRHVGGMSTSGINTAESEHMLKWTIGGFAGEFYDRIDQYYTATQSSQAPLPPGDRLHTPYFFESSVALEVYTEMLEEAGVTVIFGAAVEEVAKNGTRIESITLSDGKVLEADVFVDASYEGDLMARAGVSYVIGRESKNEFQEEAAGIRFNRETVKAATVDADGNLLPGISGWAKDYQEGDAHPGVMNYNFRFTVAKDPALQVPIPAPETYDAGRYALLKGWMEERTARGEKVRLTDVLDLYERRNGKFELNNKQAAVISLGHFGGQFEWPDASYEQRERIYQDHLDYTLGLLHFLANDPSVPENVREEMRGLGLHKDEFADNGHLPYQLYVREARRMRGETVVTQHDVQTDRRKPDSIGMSSHFIDCHHVQRLAVSPTEFVNEGRIWRLGYAYQIPYRALLPKADECTNLLVPVAASFSHVAFCTLRLESVWMITGHAAGVASALAAEQSVPVQQVPLATLQTKLREQGQVVDFIPGEKEKTTDLNGPPEF